MKHSLVDFVEQREEGHAGWELPDLIVVDGGKGQLKMALAALQDVGVANGESLPDVVALAKERTHDEAEKPLLESTTNSEPKRSNLKKQTLLPDRVFLPHAKDAIWLRPNTAELFCFLNCATKHTALPWHITKSSVEKTRCDPG